MKKIMFSDEYRLTEAVLNGTKTMTRRIMRLREEEAKVYDSLAPDTYKLLDEYVIARYSPYQVGDEVAIAMSYYHLEQHYRRNARCRKYLKDNGLTWRSLHGLQGCYNKMYVCADLMPKRIRITDIRIERLHDISPDDCLKEGVRQDGDGAYYVPDLTYRIHRCYSQLYQYQTPQEAFERLFTKLSGRKIWDLNPRVFVYTFQLIN